MSDNWAMDLAREEQVYSSDTAVVEVEWPEDSLSSPSSEDDYIEQVTSLQKVRGSITDDGVSQSSSLIIASLELSLIIST